MYNCTKCNTNYDLWVEFVEPYINKNSNILDLACGTGTFITMLKLKGYNVSGLINSVGEFENLGLWFCGSGREVVEIIKYWKNKRGVS